MGQWNSINVCLKSKLDIVFANEDVLVHSNPTHKQMYVQFCGGTWEILSNQIPIISCFLENKT